MRLYRKYFVIFIGIFVLSILPLDVRTQELLEGIVAVVGDNPLTFSEVEERVGLMVLQGVIPETEMNSQQIRREIVEEMIKEKLLMASAERSGIEVFQDELNRMVESQVESVAASFPSQAAFEAELARQNMSLPELKSRYRKVLREKILQEKILDREVRSKVTVAEREIRNYFEHFRDELPVAGLYHSYKCLHIPVSPDSARKVDVVAELEMVKKKIDSGEMSFSDAAKTFSEDPGSAARGGTLGKTNFGTLMSRFEEMVKKLEPGVVSQSFETRLGYHLVLVEDKSEEWYDARHILKRLSIEEKDWIIAEKRATALRDRIASGELTFEEMVSMYPDGVEDQTNGLPIDKIPKNLLTVLEAAEENGAPTIVKSDNEFLILLPGKKGGGGRMDYNQARSYISQKLRREKMESRLQRFLEQEKKRTYIKINDYYGIGNNS